MVDYVALDVVKALYNSNKVTDEQKEALRVIVKGYEELNERGLKNDTQ